MDIKTVSAVMTSLLLAGWSGIAAADRRTDFDIKVQNNFGPAATMSATQGVPIAYNIEVCADFGTNFTDFATGDYWTLDPTKGVDGYAHYPARGVAYEIIDGYTTHKGFLSDQTGCVNLTVTLPRHVVGEPLPTFWVYFHPNARVNGVDLQSFQESDFNPDPTSTRNLNLLTAFQSPAWFRGNVPVQNGRYPFSILAPNSKLGRQWQLLAVGTWMFSRSDFHIHDGVSRNCCTYYGQSIPLGVGTYGNPSGSCNAPFGSDYAHRGPPVIYVSTASGNTSRYRSGIGNEVVPAIASSTGTKYIAAHETGHVVVALRMGDSAPKSGEAPLDGCMGDWWGPVSINPKTKMATGSTKVDCDDGESDSDPACPVWDHTNNNINMFRGTFTKEYSSMASNEGWADFVAAWAWNRRTEPDCISDHLTFHDFDLDGDLDNYFPANPKENGWIDCAGTPSPNGVPPAGNPITMSMDGRNWLHDMEVAPDLSGCTTGGNEENRSTVNDWAKLFWDMNNTVDGEGIAIADLADLYVDMCPLTWAMTDMSPFGGPADPGELPTQRLISSANHHFLATELNRCITNIVP